MEFIKGATLELLSDVIVQDGSYYPKGTVVTVLRDLNNKMMVTAVGDSPEDFFITFKRKLKEVTMTENYKRGDTVVLTVDQNTRYHSFKCGDCFELGRGFGDDTYVLKSTNSPHLLITSDKYFKRKGVNIMKDEYELKTGKWIVGSISKQTGDLSFANTPKTHTNKLDALAEAKRLARLHTDKKFVFVQIGGIASTVDVMVE